MLPKSVNNSQFIADYNNSLWCVLFAFVVPVSISMASYIFGLEQVAVLALVIASITTTWYFSKLYYLEKIEKLEKKINKKQ